MITPNFSIILELKAKKRMKIRRYTVGVSYLSFEIIKHRIFPSHLLESGN